MGWLGRRSTGDLLVLLIATTVCFSVLAGGFGVFIAGLLYPDRDNTAVVRAIGDVINTLLGLLAGFLAGRTDAVREHLADRPAAPDERQAAPEVGDAEADQERAG